MSSLSAPARPLEGGRRATWAWSLSQPMWTGLSLVAMWLAVLFVGIFGGDFVTTGPTTHSIVPAVAVVVPFAFVATLLVARWGFGVRKSTADELREGIEAERRAREELAAEVAALRDGLGS